MDLGRRKIVTKRLALNRNSTSVHNNEPTNVVQRIGTALNGNDICNGREGGRQGDTLQFV